MFRLFEQLLHPYPEAEPDLPPAGFFAFMWACTEGLRGYIVGLAVLSALISGYEAWLFSVLGQVVDWAARTPPGSFLAAHGEALGVFAAVLLASIGLVACESLLKRQTLAMNYPLDRKSTRLNSSHLKLSRMPSSA